MASQMHTHDPIWVYPDVDLSWVKKIKKEFNIHPVTAEILAARGFDQLEEIHEFLYGKLPNLLPPEKFTEMNKAVDRIFLALQKKEKVLIYGDNDVDGMTATALLTDFLRRIGLETFYLLPTRASLNQNILQEALSFALKTKCSLLITVDCGITAFEEIEKITAKNIDVIVTDHHEPTGPLPKCTATLNPKLAHNTYPYRDLTGVGVAFKLAHAITNRLLEQDLISPEKIDLKEFLDLVALGTIADMGSLKGENRILVRYGLNELKKTKRIGLSKLLSTCDLDLPRLSPIDIGSKVAPRLNSLGRVADPLKGVELLLLKEEKKADKLVEEIELNNTKRQKIERKIFEEIETLFTKDPSLLQEKAIVLYSEKWHPGVIAIVSARISKQYNRPTLILSLDKGIGKGSMRTISEFPLLPVLKKNEDLFLSFGGHDYAAGLVMEESAIPKLKKSFLEMAKRSLKDKDILSKIYLDAKVEFSDLTFDFMDSLDLLKPFGHENPPPLLYTEANQTWTPKVIGKAHLKLFLEQNERTLEGIAFNMANRKEIALKKNLPLKIAFTPQVNFFDNKASIQLHIRDFKGN